MASHHQSGNIDGKDLKDTHQNAIMIKNPMPQRHSRHPTGTKTWISAALNCLESVVSDKSISEHLVLRLVIWKDVGKLDVGNLEYDTEVGDSIRQGTENDMDFLDMCRSQIGCLNEKLQTFANVTVHSCAISFQDLTICSCKAAGIEFHPQVQLPFPAKKPLTPMNLAVPATRFLEKSQGINCRYVGEFHHDAPYDLKTQVA